MDRLGGSVRAPARRAGDPGSNPGPDENFYLKLTKYTMGFTDNFNVSVNIFRAYGQ